MYMYVYLYMYMYMSINIKFMRYCYARNEKCLEWSNKGKGLGSRGGKGSRGPYSNRKVPSTNEVEIEEKIEHRLSSSETALGTSMDGIKKTYKKIVDICDDKESSEVENKTLGVSKLSSPSSSVSNNTSQVIDSNSKRKSPKIVKFASVGRLNREILLLS
jgi:hypothetical protein